MINIEASNFELSEITRTIQKQDIYAELINIDLTTLNSLFGYDTTNIYKDHIIKYVKQNLKNNIIFSKIIGGKILIITRSKISKAQKQGLQEESKKILKEDNKYIYITEKTMYQNKLKVKELLEKYISIEIYLNQKRNNIQKYLTKSLNSNEIKEVSQTWIESIQGHKEIIVNLDRSNYGNILRLVKKSVYLTQAVQ